MNLICLQIAKTIPTTVFQFNDDLLQKYMNVITNDVVSRIENNIFVWYYFLFFNLIRIIV